MESDGREDAHKILRDAMEKAGIVDGFYGGVLMNGKDISSFQVGIPERSCYENVERTQRVVGMMGSLQYQLLKEVHEKQEDGFKN